MVDHPRLARCISHCSHCGIRFLTHPRNAGRCNLRCPFGCRQHHRRKQSSQRATAYYRTTAGQRKKKLLNARRSGDKSRPQTPETATAAQGPSPSSPPPDVPAEELHVVLDGIVLTAAVVKTSPLLEYLQTVVRLIEGRSVTRGQLIASLLGAMRQHSIAYRSRTDYVLRFLHQHPP